MKKKLFILAVFAFVSAAIFAQPRAIGVRVSNGFEASYQHALDDNMISADLGLSFGGSSYGYYGTFTGRIQAVATYDWIFPIDAWSNSGEWNWYVGAGAGVSAGWGYADDFTVGVAGRIGLEYIFDFPLQLSVDYRPVIGPAFNNGNVSFFDQGFYSAGTFGVSARYVFD